jgi:phosphatidate cytidylyltransferase
MEKSLVSYVGYGAVVVYYAMLYFDLMEYTMFFVSGLLLLLLLVLVLRYPRIHSRQVMMAFFGVAYVAGLLSYVYLARILENGMYIVWLMLLSAFGYDTFAYCTGLLTAKTIGNHKMTPKLSPKKSYEGLIGGLLGAGILGFVYANIWGGYLPQLWGGPFGYGIVCAAGGGVAQLGDLAASAMKRQYDIKDFGKLIPGHGGVLDRFDSLMFTAPVIYCLVTMVLPLAG